jgi:hypothetical protein
VDINKARKGVTVLDVPSAVFNSKLSEFYKEKNLIKVPKVKNNHFNKLFSGEPKLRPQGQESSLHSMLTGTSTKLQRSLENFI